MSDQGVRTAPPSVDDLDGEIRRTCQIALDQAATSQDPRDLRELAQAVLAFSQAIVILDPKLVAPQGVPANALHPPKPMIQMDRTNGQGNGAAKQG